MRLFPFFKPEIIEVKNFETVMQSIAEITFDPRSARFAESPLFYGKVWKDSFQLTGIRSNNNYVRFQIRGKFNPSRTSLKLELHVSNGRIIYLLSILLVFILALISSKVYSVALFAEITIILYLGMFLFHWIDYRINGIKELELVRKLCKKGTL